MSAPRTHGENGAVAVMVAVLMPLFVLLLAFAVDASHWWAHKAHLQVQVDSGVFAGGLGPWLPVCDKTVIEDNALKYASDDGREIQPGLTNRQYGTDDRPWDVNVLINADKYESQGGTEYAYGDPCAGLQEPPTGGCPGQDEDGNPVLIPCLDLRATESNLPSFLSIIPGLSVLPWDSDLANARARVQIEKQGGGEGIKPIAVRDDTAYQCAEIIRLAALSDGSTGIQLGSPITLARTTGPPTTSYTEFQNTGGTSITMPTGSESDNSMYIRVKLYANRDQATGACTGPSDEFPINDEGDPIGGANFINVYSEGSPAGGAPAVHGVSVTNGSCSPDQYFSFYKTATSCSVTVVADVLFPAGANNPRVDINGTQASGGPTIWTATFNIAAASGPHTFSIRPRYTGCGNACNSSAIRQQAYSALDDDGEPSSTGPISMVQIGEGGPGVGANSFKKSTTHNLVFTVRLNGLANSLPTDPPVVLRYRVNNKGFASKRTGLIDCGQGNGANADEEAILNGCPRPLYIWPVGTTCVTPTNSPDPTPIDCVGNTPGNRTNKIPGAIRQRVGNSCNIWNAYRDSNGTTAFPPGDPRMMTFIITSPADLSGKSGSKPDIPIQLFATFYVTGADRMTGNGNGCQNEPYPGPGSNDQAAIWGHWIKWANTDGNGTGEGCKKSEFGSCVVVLTE